MNIDFLSKRPDLKVIITSATIDTQCFSKHFNNAPVIEVSGRTYPVEVRYHERDDDDDIIAIIEAVDEVSLHDRPLSATEQNRVFNPSHKRRIVLATNVAETSLTVPRIKAVIDTGLARISRYSLRNQIQRLLQNSSHML